MTPAEIIYRVMLWLYPAEHRRAYGRLMRQHARDLNLAARPRGRRHVAALCVRLVSDGIVNAVVEHMEAIMTAKGPYKPVPWLNVLLVVVPGLWVALSRRHADVLAPLLLALRGGYILLIALGVPAFWLLKRRFPVWGLLFAGTLVWFLTYRIGSELTRLTRLPSVFGWEMGIVLLNIALATALFILLLRGRRLPGTVWALMAFMVLFSLLGAIIYGSISLGNAPEIPELLQYLMASLALPAEGLMLVAVGLLAARQHGVFALLVVLGGYSYLFMDNDYLFGYPSRDWSWLPLYLVTVSLLFLVLAPIALLRAKSRRGRALAVFGPVVLFLVARLTIPIVVTRQPIAALRPGDVGMSLFVLLSLILAWSLYGHRGVLSREAKVNLTGRAV